VTSIKDHLPNRLSLEDLEEIGKARAAILSTEPDPEPPDMMEVRGKLEEGIRRVGGKVTGGGCWVNGTPQAHIELEFKGRCFYLTVDWEPDVEKWANHRARLATPQQ
jgi:hypothetical protein